MLAILDLAASGCVPCCYCRLICLPVVSMSGVSPPNYSNGMSSSAQSFMKQRAAMLCNRWGEEAGRPWRQTYRIAIQNTKQMLPRLDYSHSCSCFDN